MSSTIFLLCFFTFRIIEKPMKSLIRISDATIIAIHTIKYFIDSSEESLSAKKVAEALDVSYNHLSKVIQTLQKAGFLESVRGPAGGYTITNKGKNAKIKDILKLFEGRTSYSICFLNSRVCERDRCKLKEFLIQITDLFNKFADMYISDI